MSAYKEFKKSGYRQKTDIIQKFGIFIARRRAHGCIVQLFAIRDFYVEVWSADFIPWQNIVRIKSFKKCYNLAPYLKQVDVKGVLSA